MEASHLAKHHFTEVNFSVTSLISDTYSVYAWDKRGPYRPKLTTGPVFDTEQEAVSQWNSMFSKAPFVAHMGEV